jgi:hypothetical protein
MSIYLVKDSDDLVCHCHCQPAPMIAVPHPADCPWCGCGWLFSCIDCRKAFTFARAVVVPWRWDEIAVRDLSQFGLEPEAVPVDHIKRIAHLMDRVILGQRYVHLDGRLVWADADGVRLVGHYASHALDRIPQVAALTDPRWKEMLSSRAYWEGGENGIHPR